jgi:hypothetical protein
MATVKLHHKVELEIDNIKGFKRWTPHQQYVNDVHFMQVYKFDRSLTRFALHKQMNFKDKVTCNVKFMDELQSLRTDASNASVRDALKECTEDEAALRRLSRRKAKSSDKSIVSEIVTITIPAFEDLQEKTMRVLWGVKNSAVFMELTKDNLDYVVTRIQKDFNAERTGRSRGKKSPAAHADAGNGASDGGDDDGDEASSVSSSSS